jgi:O-antigen ligase
MAPLIAAAGLLAAPFRRLPALARAGGVPLAFVIAFVLWAAASAIWSPAPTRGLAALKLLAGAATGLSLVGGVAAASARGRTLVRAACAAAAIALGALLSVEALFDFPLNRLVDLTREAWRIAIDPGHGATILIILLWPAMFALRGRLRTPIALLIAAFGVFLCAQFQTYSNIPAFIVAAVAAACAWLAPRATLIAISVAAGAMILLSPLAAALLPGRAGLDGSLPFSWVERIEIWRSTAARIAEAPAFGHGLDAARTMSAPAQIGGETYHFIALHPHNAGLQIWLETGFVGASLSAAALLLGGLTAARALTGRSVAAAAAGGAAAYVVHANLSFGVWQEWWIATAFLFAACITALRGGDAIP